MEQQNSNSLIPPVFTHLCFLLCRIKPEGLVVSLGRQNLTGTDTNEVSKMVTGIVRYPLSNGKFRDNDIALLRLSSSVMFSDYIRPVCLAASDSSIATDTRTWVTGWGWINPEGELLFNLKFKLKF